MLKLFIPITSAVTKGNLFDTILTLSNEQPAEVDFFYNSSLIYVGSGDIPLASEALLTDDEKNAVELKKINVIAEELNGKGYSVKIINPTGFLEPELIQAAKKAQPDLIVMFTQGSHNLVHDVLGTTTTTILNELSVPIMVIPFNFDLKKISKAAVGLGLDGEDPDYLRPYLHFAEKMKIESSYVKINSDFQFDIINDELMLSELQKTFPDINFNVHIRKADKVDDGLMKYADEDGADIIVAFTTKRNIIEKLFHHSVSKGLAMHSKKPVLIYHY